MDKVNKYKKVIKDLIAQVVAMSEPIENGVENQLIIDDERGHYLYMGVGWEENSQDWFYATFIHIDIKENGKVWLQHDGTDLRIANELIQNGVLKNDIVIGFQRPVMRKMMDGFAVA